MRASRLLLSLVIGFTPIHLQAGPYTDLLGRCLVDSTSMRDRQALVRWMIAGMSVHPAVQGFVKLDQGGQAAADEEAAGIVEGLLIESCRKETSEAMQYEGNIAIEMAFDLLGQVAAGELMNDPAVNSAMMGFTNYLDQGKFEATFGPFE